MKSPLERVVGGTASQQKEVLDDIQERFEFQEHGDAEIIAEKTLEVIDCIRIANEVTSEVLRQYGIEKEDIPEDKFHIIKREAWPENISDAGAFFSSISQAIVHPEEADKLVFTHNIIHEIFHFKSYQAAQITLDNVLDDYRVGFSVNTRDGKKSQFRNINEAITEDLTYKAMQTPIFKAQMQGELEKLEAIMQEHANVKGMTVNEIFDKPIFHAEVGQIKADGTTEIECREFSYQKEREGLQILVNKLFERNVNSFDTKEEVYALFVQGAFYGNLLKAGRLIESTFGTGTFRKIAESDSEDEFLRLVNGL